MGETLHLRGPMAMGCGSIKPRWHERSYCERSVQVAISCSTFTHSQVAIWLTLKHLAHATSSIDLAAAQRKQSFCAPGGKSTPRSKRRCFPTVVFAPSRCLPAACSWQCKQCSSCLGGSCQDTVCLWPDFCCPRGHESSKL